MHSWLSRPLLASSLLALSIGVASGLASAEDGDEGMPALQDANQGRIGTHIVPSVSADAEQNLTSDSAESDAQVTPAIAELRKPGAYEVGPGDKLLIKFFQRDELSGEFRVRSDGQITLPLIGSFSVQGQTPAEVEQLISVKFFEMTKSSAHAVVDVIERRPFFVAGDVNRPGTFQYFPRMTVLHAVALAGGIYRMPQAPNQFMDITREQWRLRSSKADAAVTLAKRERLKALLNRQDEVDFPELISELVGTDQGERIISTQRRLFEQARRWRNDQKDYLKSAVQLAEEEIKALRTRLATINDVMKVHDDELSTRQKLLERGLTRRQSVYQKQYAISNLLTSAANVEAEIKRAEMKRNRAMQEQNEFWPSQDRKLADELATVEAEFERNMREIQASNNMLGQSMATGMRQAGFNAASVEYRILRRRDGEVEELAAKENDRMLPGDVLKVALVSAVDDAMSRKSIQAHLSPPVGQAFGGGTEPAIGQKSSSAIDEKARRELAKDIADLKKIAGEQGSILAKVAQSQTELVRRVDKWGTQLREVIERTPAFSAGSIMSAALEARAKAARTSPGNGKSPAPAVELPGTGGDQRAGVVEDERVAIPGSDDASRSTDDDLVVLPARGPMERQVDQRRLALALQSELAKLGCYRGAIDGEWGPMSRRAVSDYARSTGKSFETFEPNLKIYAAIVDSGAQRGVCGTKGQRIVTRLPVSTNATPVRFPRPETR
jgi:protein involved in polysaccharide export with SLBB domain